MKAVDVKTVLIFFAACIGVVIQAQAESRESTKEWGSFKRPFSMDSPWNIRPEKPIFSDFEIPRSKFFPSITSGEWSTGAYEARAVDGPQVIKGLPGSAGIYMADSGSSIPSLTIPHWPDNASAALESDGHADIVDSSTGIIHSFFQLKRVDGRWHAGLYAWSRIDGRGWGNPSHFYQGARATGVPAMAGLIRAHEINDGERTYKHALAISLTYNALSANPAYIYPATAADRGAETTNSGKIPEGALLMLPENFPSNAIKNPELKKIAETLKLYGGYVVDRNIGTPFAIYVERGSRLNLHAGGWNPQTGQELDRIRSGLRQVIAADQWVAEDGTAVPMKPPMNVLSMRGPWILRTGSELAKYDTYSGSLQFKSSVSSQVVQATASNTVSKVAWAIPVRGNSYTFTANATGGSKLQLLIVDKKQLKLIESPSLGNLEKFVFEWPEEVGMVYLVAFGPARGQEGSVSGSLVPN